MSSTEYSLRPPLLPRRLPTEEGEDARRRLVHRSWIKRLLVSLRRRRVQVNDVQETDLMSAKEELTTIAVHPIELINPSSDTGVDSKDHFAWAVLYENQRGITVFSSPYYSHRSLLPMDPAPFTLPSASLAPSEQPFTSLDDYQLPDGTWRWVSKVWMVDMRSDTGEVQYDGFEYNWLFRKHHWRAEIGPCSAGAWVRRRRWIRLMMRPGKYRRHEDGKDRMSPDTGKDRCNVPSSDSLSGVNADNIWLGRDPEDDWNRCHAFMKHLEVDGHKLELWHAWLESPPSPKGKGKEVSSGIDEFTCPTEVVIKVTSPPQKEYIIPVLQGHLHDMLHLFVFPDSRARFLGLLVRTGMMPMADEDGLNLARKEVDFWSYSEELLDRLSQAKSKGVL